MSKGPITGRYLSARILLALGLILFAALIAHYGSRSITADIDRTAAIADKLDAAQLLVSEITINLYGVSIAEDDSRAYSYRLDNKRVSEQLETAVTALEEISVEDWYGEETRNLIENPILDPFGQIRDLIFIIQPLTEVDGQWGEAARPRIKLALDLSRVIVPMVNRLQDAERAGIAKALTRAGRWSDMALALSAAFVALTGLAIFRPLVRHILSSQAELEHERQRAENASAAKSNFLATMSHEIRTPMNGVLGMAELLRAANLPERESKMVAVIQNSGGTLMRLLNDILDYSKMEAGKFQLDSQPFSPKSLCEDAIALFSGQAANKQIELSLETSGPLGASYLGDPARIRQIVANIMGNAVKFTESGSVKLKLGAGERQGDQQNLLIEITDTGPGIAEEELANIFEAFEQGKGDFGSRAGGTGLGLAICRNLAALMGGEISATSQPGVGSTFRIALRLKSDPSEAEDDPGSATVSERRGFAAPVGAFEDDALTTALANAGVALTFFETADALTAAMEEPLPDFIIGVCEEADDIWRLPRRLARRLDQRSSGGGRPKLFALTTASPTRCRQAGFDHAIQRSLPPGVITLQIASRLGGVEDLPDRSGRGATRKAS